MREIPQAMLDAFSGSSYGATLECVATYNGEVVAENLEVSDWSLSWRLGDQQAVQGSASFVFQDPTGSLAPWGYDEPLSVGGSRIATVFQYAGETVPLGEWLITSNQPNEAWRLTRYGDGQDLRWVTGGATVPVEGADLTQLIADDRFMAPESPPAGATVFSEIERLCDGVIGVQFGTEYGEIKDRPVPRNMVYNEERINTIADLAHMVGEYRVNGDGLLEIFDPKRPTKPHWILEPGPDGTLISVGRQQSRDELYNAVVASGTTEGGKEIRAYSVVENGPLRFDGPFGRKPMDKSAIADTLTGIQDDANTTLNTKVRAATTILDVHCTANPSYEIGDWGQIAQPMIDGAEYPLIGRCVGTELKGGTDGLGDMKLEMECSTSDVLAVARYIRRANT